MRRNKMKCQEIQLLISENLDTEKPLSNDIKNHIQNCPQCKSFKQSILNFDNVLNSHSDDRQNVSSALTNKIIQACLDSKATAEPKKTIKFSSVVYYSLLAAACAVFAFNLNTIFQAKTPSKPTITAPKPAIAKSTPKINEDSTEALSWLLEQNPRKVISKAVPSAKSKITNFIPRKAQKNTVVKSTKKAANLLFEIIASSDN